MKELARQRFDETCDHDRAGREEEAIPCYFEALELGLGDPWRQQALLGLGSSYRVVMVIQMAMTSLPLASPSSRCLIAAGVSRRGYVRSITGASRSPSRSSTVRSR